MKEVPEVLFVCVHNAGRSQMAAGLLDHHAAGRVHVRSAGSAPADTINPAVVAAMEEIGVDLSKEFPKPLTDDVVRAADVVITMGCGDACPVYPGKRYLDWELDDPAGKPLDQVRPIRDEIDRRVRELLVEIADQPTPPRRSRPVRDAAADRRRQRRRDQRRVARPRARPGRRGDPGGSRPLPQLLHLRHPLPRRRRRPGLAGVGAPQRRRAGGRRAWSCCWIRRPAGSTWPGSGCT